MLQKPIKSRQRDQLTSVVHAELTYGLIDRHVVRYDVIVDQKLQLVADVVALRHQHGRLNIPKSKEKHQLLNNF